MAASKHNRLLWFVLGFLAGCVLVFNICFLLRLDSVSTRMPGRNTAFVHDSNQHSNTGVHRRNTLYVGVLTAEKFLRTRADACWNTWVKRLPPKDVEFFYRVRNESGWKEWKGNIVHLEANDDVYPPLEKLFRMFQYICSHHLHNYDWFMRADDDTYIKTDKLVNFLATLDKDKAMYLGQLGRGRKEERNLLGLDGHGYCLGGPGFILSRPAMLGICPHLEECLRNAVSNYDDTELGRCVTRHLAVECTGSQKNKLFHHAYPSSATSAYGGDLRNDRDFKAALTLHPAKEPELMYNLHRYYLRSLREVNKTKRYSTQTALRTEASTLKGEKSVVTPRQLDGQKEGHA